MINNSFSKHMFQEKKMEVMRTGQATALLLPGLFQPEKKFFWCTNKQAS